MSIRVVDTQTGTVVTCSDMIDAGMAISQISKGREE
jgi:hypothetical protein